MKFVDLFACGGGATYGATCAGLNAVLAVDYHKESLAVHAANHPGCAHLQLELGTDSSTETVMSHPSFPKKGEEWHLHMSPPCNNLCAMNQAAHGDSKEGREQMTQEGLRLVKWSLSFLIKAKPTTWSFENVNHPALAAVLNEFKAKHSLICDFDVFKFEDYGLPAKRTRILAGSPQLIDRFRTHKALRRKVTVSRIFAAERWEMPSRRISGSGRKSMRSATKKGFAVTSAGITFVNAKNKIVRKMTPKEVGRIQTFPSTYKWSGVTAVDASVIGNALPPLIMGLLLGMTHNDAKEKGLGIGRRCDKGDKETGIDGRDEDDDEESDEEEGAETLADRKRRLRPAVMPATTEEEEEETASGEDDEEESDEEEVAETLADRKRRLHPAVMPATTEEEEDVPLSNRKRAKLNERVECDKQYSLDMLVGVIVASANVEEITYGQLKRKLKEHM